MKIGLMTGKIVDVDIHKWLQTIMLGVITTLISLTYNLMRDNQKTLGDHETRISVLEDRGKRPEHRQTSFLEAILTEPLTIKSEWYEQD